MIPDLHSGLHAAVVPTATDGCLALEVREFAAGWDRAVSRPMEIPVWRIAAEEYTVRVISVAMADPEVRTRSFGFAERRADIPVCQTSAGIPVCETNADPSPRVATRGLLSGRNPELLSSGSTRRPPPATPQGHTRVRPPDDVVKLEDRLRYVLQPSLESLLGARSLDFPLRPFAYQMAGVAFLYPRHAAILADEMGLGKTMQAITAIRLLLHNGEIRSVLLICPKPLVPNWQREFSHWAPEIPVMVIEGDQSRRRWQWQLPSAPVRIANYELLHRDREFLEAGPADCSDGGKGDRHLLPARPEGCFAQKVPVTFSASPAARFDLVLLDEAQRIKNAASATNQAVRALVRKRSWALTGTPVENGPQDLVGIFEFLAPGLLSPDVKPGRIGRTIRDYVLRRTKEHVLSDLPPKLFCDAELSLTPEQEETYRLARDEGVLRLTQMGDSATIQHVFELVLRLKQICNFDPATGASAKLERLEADLEEVVPSGRKAIVFSQWVQTLQRLSEALRRFRPLEYHGRVSPVQREVVLRRFREDPDCPLLLISYGAGGVGLNLQTANYAFLFDRWWNPAVEDQAINRVHRIGVAGPVTVVRFLMLDSIEERIDRILQQKRDLFDVVFSGVTGPRRFGLTEEELFGLFDLRCPGAPGGVAA